MSGELSTKPRHPNNPGLSIDWALAAINGTAKLERAEMRAADERRAGTHSAARRLRIAMEREQPVHEPHDGWH